jgi:hypothetical protein
MLSGKSCNKEESWPKTHTERRHFQKMLYENDLKIKNKPNSENFKLRTYALKLPAGAPNFVILSLERDSLTKI